MDVESGLSSVDSGEVSVLDQTSSVKPTVRKWTAMHAMLIPYSRTAEEADSAKKALESISALPEVLSFMGIHEIYMLSMYKALLIEFVGTASFTYIHIGIVTACQQFPYPPLQIGIAHGVLLTLFIYQFAMSSGAHFNSLITYSSIITGHIPLLRGILYIAMQIFGATAGAGIMLRSAANTTLESTMLGTCSMGSLEPKQALAIEFFFSMAMLYTVYGTAFNLRQREIYGAVLPPLLIGITLALIIFASASLAPAPFTGAGANPSLCLGTAWAYSGSNLAGHDTVLDHHWVYWAGPILASLGNGAIYAVVPPHHHKISVTTNDHKIE